MSMPQHVQVGEMQRQRKRQRKVTQLKHYASVALTCMESFGLHVASLQGVTGTEAALTLQLDQPSQVFAPQPSPLSAPQPLKCLFQKGS